MRVATRGSGGDPDMQQLYLTRLHVSDLMRARSQPSGSQVNQVSNVVSQALSGRGLGQLAPLRGPTLGQGYGSYGSHAPDLAQQGE